MWPVVTKTYHAGALCWSITAPYNRNQWDDSSPWTIISEMWTVIHMRRQHQQMNQQQSVRVYNQGESRQRMLENHYSQPSSRRCSEWLWFIWILLPQPNNLEIICITGISYWNNLHIIGLTNVFHTGNIPVNLKLSRSNRNVRQAHALISHLQFNPVRNLNTPSLCEKRKRQASHARFFSQSFSSREYCLFWRSVSWQTWRSHVRVWRTSDQRVDKLVAYASSLALLFTQSCNLRFSLTLKLPSLPFSLSLSLFIPLYLYFCVSPKFFYRLFSASLCLLSSLYLLCEYVCV